jgi:hypothetical protein
MKLGNIPVGGFFSPMVGGTSSTYVWVNNGHGWATCVEDQPTYDTDTPSFFGIKTIVRQIDATMVCPVCGAEMQEAPEGVICRKNACDLR